MNFVNTIFVFLFLQLCAVISNAQNTNLGQNKSILHFEMPESLHNAKAAYQNRDFDKAIRYGEHSLTKMGMKENLEAIVFAHNLLGASYTKTRQYEKAFAQLEQGLAIGQQHLAFEHILLSDCHFYLGVFYDMMAKGKESLNHHQKALEIRLSHFGNQHPLVAESYKGLGEVYMFSIQDYQNAVLFFQKSIEILEKHPPSNQYEMYAVYFNLAHASRMLEDSDKALSYAYKALSVVKSRRELLPSLEKCYSLLGDIYYGKTDYNSAMNFMKQAMNQSIALGGASNFNLIQNYTSMGLLQGEMNHSAMAISCFRKSLSIIALQRNPNVDLQADNFMHIGRIYQKTKQFDSARFYFNRCLQAQLSVYGTEHSETSEAYSYLASFFQESGDLDSAAYYIQKSLGAAIGEPIKGSLYENPSIEKIRDREDLFELFGNKGSILLDRYAVKPNDLKNLTSSLACFKIADTFLALNRSAYRQEGSKLFFADHYHHIYEKALEVAYLLFDKTKEEQYFADALMFMEKSKAILLAESLNKAEVFTKVGLPDSIRDLEKNLNSALTAYRSQLESLNQKTNSEAGQQQIQSQIFQISQKQEKLMDTIAKIYPQYFQIKYQKLSPLPEIRAYAKKNNSTIVEYFWGDENVFLLALSEVEMIFRKVTIVDSLTASIMQYSHSLEKVPAYNDHAEKFMSFLSSSNQIYHSLLAPLLENKKPQRIILIRDGPLLAIPFESLTVSKTNSDLLDYQKLDYLIQHRTISYAHSADLLIKSSARAQATSSENKILAFSYSRLNSPGNEIATSRASNELPGAAREIHAISKVLPGLFFEGEEATEQKFKMHAGNFDILHLAVHGRADPEKQFSGSLFFKQSQDKQDDGELHVFELYDLTLKARLAVLSACESGVGKVFRGEGVFSIARGFAYAGCPSTVMTLWPVIDVSSAAIMTDFYSELNRGSEIDVALRTAKLNYLATTDSRLAHPAFWAAYIPTGNMQPLIKKPFPKTALWLVVIMCITITGILWTRKKHFGKGRALVGIAD